MPRKAGGSQCVRILASCVTAAILLILSLGCYIWASNELRDDESPASFLQMRIETSRTAALPHHSMQGRCPEKIMKWHPHCRVLYSRANFKVGGDIRPSEGQKQSVLLYTALDMSPLVEDSETMSIVGWDPVIDEVPSACEGHETKVSLVHHINVYAYPNKPNQVSLQSGRTYSKAEIERLNLQESSFRMLASHDKLAGRYLLPKGYGIPLLEEHERAMVEHHILFPKCWAFGKDVPHSSGFDLYITTKRRMRPAALIGALNFNMDVQPLQGSVEWVTRISANNLVGVVQPTGEWPEILAVHLHTHDVAHTKYFEVQNADGSLAFRSEPEKAGYGLQEQSFFNLPDLGWPRLQLRAGQQLLQHCLFDSDHLREPVHYGLNHGEEMCAPLLVLGGPGLRLRSTLLSSDDGFLLQVHRRLQAWLQDVLDDAHRLIRDVFG